MIQVRLWNDCYNNCSFCSLSGKKHITDIKDKKARILNLLTLKDNNGLHEPCNMEVEVTI